MRLFHAELLKIRTAPRTALALLLALLGIVGLGAGATASNASGPGRALMIGWDVLSVAAIAPLFALILGILLVTWEYRHGTITQTYLATPRRERVVAAKAVVALVAGAVLALLSIAVALGFARLWASFDLESGHWELAGRMVLAAALWCVLGAGLGALLQSQIGAIISAFVWFFIAEEVIAWRLPSIGDYLPGHALDRLQSQNVIEGEASPFGTVLEPYGLWVAGLLVAGYAAGVAVLGAASAMRRDVP